MNEASRLIKEAIWESERKIERDLDEKQIAAELANDETFFIVDWAEFDTPKLEIKKLLPLSLGINPLHRCAQISWAKSYIENVTGKPAEKLNELIKRHKKLVENLDIVRGDNRYQTNQLD